MIGFFHQPKPRRFHHTPVYYDEHHDRVVKIEERARRELHQHDDKDFDPESLRGAFTNSSRRLLRQRRRTMKGSLIVNTGALIIIVLALLLFLIYLSR